MRGKLETSPREVAARVETSAGGYVDEVLLALTSADQVTPALVAFDLQFEIAIGFLCRSSLRELVYVPSWQKAGGILLGAK